ncbi:acyl carrier protein [Jatrophihabitans endophyticus]|uniref:acyl carrier protein n=1 Tax=Jatrophihabitans endophyticus TaxID=1206085 RepID=UPI001160F395|nr:acyl carrier protein [Jatrophihabitans endophyticus]
MTTTNAGPTVDDITGIVRDVLQRDEIDPDGDLFQQGATSLAYVRVIAEINNRWQLSLNGSEVDGEATVVRLTKAAAAAADA